MAEKKLRVLVVDDHEDTVITLKFWLTQQGHSAAGLTDLSQVDFELSNKIVDVLIIDLLFPGMDASSDIRRIRQTFPDLKIIVMSGTPDLQLTLRAIDAGADSYLTKPIDWDALGTLLGNVRAA